MAAEHSGNMPFNFREPKFVRDLEERLHHHHRHDSTSAVPNTPRPLVPAIPDLRFEYSYIRSIQPYVRIAKVPVPEDVAEGENVVEEEQSESDEGSYEKVELSAQLSPRKAVATGEVLEVQWGMVLWITMRDQVISPLIQGALWAIASYYITPFSRGLGSKLGTAARGRLPAKEGGAVTWLRGLFATPVPSSKPRA